MGIATLFAPAEQDHQDGVRLCMCIKVRRHVLITQVLLLFRALGGHTFRAVHREGRGAHLAAGCATVRSRQQDGIPTDGESDYVWVRVNF